MSNCFNRDGWFGIVGAGRDLSLLSLLKPELPGDEQCWCRECRAVIWSVHIVIIYLGPSVTRLVVQRSKKKKGGGQTKKRIPGRVLEKLFRSPYSCKTHTGVGDMTYNPL